MQEDMEHHLPDAAGNEIDHHNIRICHESSECFMSHAGGHHLLNLAIMTSTNSPQLIWPSPPTSASRFSSSVNFSPMLVMTRRSSAAVSNEAVLIHVDHSEGLLELLHQVVGILHSILRAIRLRNSEKSIVP